MADKCIPNENTTLEKNNFNEKLKEINNVNEWENLILTYINEKDYSIKEDSSIDNDSEEFNNNKDSFYKENLETNNNMVNIKASDFPNKNDTNKKNDKLEEEFSNNEEKKIINDEKYTSKNINYNDLFLNKSNEINSIYIKNQFQNTFIFNGKEFKKYARYNKYNKKSNIKRSIYKCINNWKDNNLRKSTNKTTLCNATIEYIAPNQNIKSGYFLKKDHTEECYDLDVNPLPNKENKKYKKEILEKELYHKQSKENFIRLCEEVMNSSTVFNRPLFKEKFKEIYNSNKFNFPINTSFLSNIITKWKSTSY